MDGFMPFLMALVCKGKHKQPHPGFEQESRILFPIIINAKYATIIEDGSFIYLFFYIKY